MRNKGSKHSKDVDETGPGNRHSNTDELTRWERNPCLNGAFHCTQNSEKIPPT